MKPLKNLHDTMIEACMKSDFEVIKQCFKDGYLELNQPSGFDLFTNMCNHAPVETVKYLWDNKEDFKYIIDIHHNDNEPFKYACYYQQFDNAAYLIIDHNIEKEPQIKEFLETELFEIHPQIMSVIASKELNQKLKHELIDKNHKTKVLKI